MAPGALTSQSRNIENGSNVNVPGLYIYRIDLTTILRPNGEIHACISIVYVNIISLWLMRQRCLVKLFHQFEKQF